MIGGGISGFTIIITPRQNHTTAGGIPDPGAFNSNLVISGVTSPITKVILSLHATHTWDSDLDLSLIGPDGTTVELSTDNGSDGDNYGTGCGPTAQTVFDDAAPTAVTAGGAPFSGSFRPEGSLTAFNGKAGAAANGTWTLRAVDDDDVAEGTLLCWSLTIFRDETTTAQPPTGLRATSIEGNQVTLRWTPPAAGLAPTEYQLDGGVNPGETLASLSTGSAAPILSFSAPTGAFYVRLRSVAGGTVSGPSNEIRLFVNLPVAPSPPTTFTSVLSGSSLGLSWRNTFEGGAPTSLLLDVTGDAVASIPLPLTDHLSFAGVPNGNYALTLRTVNTGGNSGSSNVASITIPPGACPTGPSTPIRLLPYRIGSTLFVVWEPALSGGAATGFILNVTGAFVGSFPFEGRAVSATVGPGTYNFTVAATNACGTSAPTAARSITVP